MMATATLQPICPARVQASAMRGAVTAPMAKKPWRAFSGEEFPPDRVLTAWLL